MFLYSLFIFLGESNNISLTEALSSPHSLRDLSPDKIRASSFVSDFMLNRLAHHFSVDEGHFDQNSEFVVDRRRNGDEINYGLWVEADTGVMRVIMCD